MRIQLRLSLEARIILEEMKLSFLKENPPITLNSGEIIDSLFDKYGNKLKKVDWDFVRRCPEYDSILSHYTKVNPTTLSLEDSTLQAIESLKIILNESLGMVRTVYTSYVIRLLLKLAQLEKSGINIYKKE